MNQSFLDCETAVAIGRPRPLARPTDGPHAHPLIRRPSAHPPARSFFRPLVRPSAYPTARVRPLPSSSALSFTRPPGHPPPDRPLTCPPTHPLLRPVHPPANPSARPIIQASARMCAGPLTRLSTNSPLVRSPTHPSVCPIARTRIRVGETGICRPMWIRFIPPMLSTLESSY